MKSRFTPAEANRTLPLIKRIVADVLAKGRQLRELAPRHTEPAVRADLDRLEDDLRELMLEMERVGCLYKDWGFEQGLVDFPSEIDGRQVYLCWRSDEEAVTWYHPIEEGFAGRRLIPDHLLQASTA